jgi:general secretion pathway protein J
MTPHAPDRRISLERGFTLVEVLVALSLMALLAGMAWQGVAGIARTRSVSDERVDLTLRVSTVLAQWEQDLQAIHDTGVVPALTFDGATVRLVRRTEGGLQVVAWSLREQRWLRWIGPPVTQVAALQESWLASQQLLGNEAGQLRMLDGLSEWQVYFYRGNAWSNAQSSADVAAAAPAASAPPIAKAQLPTGVRVVLGFAGGPGAMSGTLTRDVLLAPQMP